MENTGMKKQYDCIVMGAAGRDFHVFLSFLKGNQHFHVKAFTATQIPFITERKFPRSLAGPGYDEDIPIFDESELPRLIRELDIDFVFFAYSDISYADLMHKSSIVQAAGASFIIAGPEHTQLSSSKPVVSITATRTGAGKSPLTQYLARYLTDQGKKVAVIRHPMPYGNLEMQAVQRFATPEDLDFHECTIEEREEYAPYVDMGIPIYAGVDYRAILDESSREADIVMWDGGNNDFSFIKPDLDIVVVDSLRAGHEIDYFPGEVNFRRADVLVIGKVRSAEPGAVEGIRERAAAMNADAAIVTADLEIDIDKPELISGQKVLVIEDGPTVTHGGMSFGAGSVAAKRYGATAVAPRSYAVGTIADTYDAYPHMQFILPAMGYSDEQRKDLTETINACAKAEGIACVVDASPARLDRMLKLEVPMARVTYRFRQLDGTPLEERVQGLL
jgi:predicted GTPase